MRRENWPTLLQDEVAAASSRAFEWGRHDCLQFAARCVAVITGEDRAARFGEYTDERGAARLLAAHGGVAGILNAELGESVPPLLARRGDVVLAQIEGRATAGICLGPVCAFAGDGVVYRPLTSVERAWRVD